ncbi:ExeA family protein [Sulfurihydrogenibium sp.]|uniref:ExeA family protein n=1 Tax=Sulfurihydrogenibium sp. TaxID=2053621 RepID=UPI003D0AE3AD
MNYLEFFGLKEDPFKITPDPDYFFESLTHRKAKNLLEYTIYSKEGFCVIIGEPGTGKTTVLKKFLSELPENFIAATIYNPMLSPEEFLKTLLDEFKIPYNKDISKNEILKKLSQFLEEKLWEGKRAIIVIDEAQLMPFETLEELRLLSNIETGKEKLVQIILVGQPELEEKLQDPKLRQLSDRITNKMFLDELTEDEVEKYINHRLKISNADKIKFSKEAINEIYKKIKQSNDKSKKKIFSDVLREEEIEKYISQISNADKIKFSKEAINEIYKHSGGIPRLINLLASRAIMAAYMQNSYTVEPNHILSALDALKKENTAYKKNRILAVAILILETIAILALIIYIYLTFF